MNAMQAAFAKSGTMPRDARIWSEIALYQNNGGSLKNLLAMAHRAYPNGDEGLSAYAQLGQSRPADVSEGRGQLLSADKAESIVPRPNHSAETPIREGQPQSASKEASVVLPSRSNSVAVGDGERGGQLRFAEQAKQMTPPRSIPMPSRDFSSRSVVQAALARSLFDTIMLPDGRRLRDIRWNDCPALAQKYRRLAHILTAVHNYAIPPDPSATLDRIVSEHELKGIVATAEEANNA